MPVASEFREAATAENAAVRIPGADSRRNYRKRGLIMQVLRSRSDESPLAPGRQTAIGEMGRHESKVGMEVVASMRKPS